MTPDELRGRVGSELGVSGWRLVDQALVDRFADVTDDRQFIHVDPARAASTAFGGTVAHGFLTLSLLSAMGAEALPRMEGRTMGVNYGFERVRFVWPVRVGSRVRGRFTLASLEDRGPEQILLRYGVTVEIEGGAKPALTAEWLALAIMAQPGEARGSEPT